MFLRGVMSLCTFDAASVLWVGLRIRHSPTGRKVPGPALASREWRVLGGFGLLRAARVSGRFWLVRETAGQGPAPPRGPAHSSREWRVRGGFGPFSAARVSGWRGLVRKPAGQRPAPPRGSARTSRERRDSGVLGPLSSARVSGSDRPICKPAGQGPAPPQGPACASREWLIRGGLGLPRAARVNRLRSPHASRLSRWAALVLSRAHAARSTLCTWKERFHRAPNCGAIRTRW